MNKNKLSKDDYKVGYLICLGYAIFSILYGIVNITTGGIGYFLPGAVFFFLYYRTKQKWKNYDSTHQNTDETNDSIPESIETHYVAGTSYRQEYIQSLGTENLDYSLTKKEIEDLYDEKDRIYEYNFVINKVELIEEPTNRYDPNAIKVVLDNVHVGYIKRGSCSHVKNLLHKNKITRLEVDIRGGKYKCLEYNDDTDKYSLRRHSSNFFIDLHIYKSK